MCVVYSQRIPHHHLCYTYQIELRVEVLERRRRRYLKLLILLSFTTTTTTMRPAGVNIRRAVALCILHRAALQRQTGGQAGDAAVDDQLRMGWDVVMEIEIEFEIESIV